MGAIEDFQPLMNKWDLYFHFVASLHSLGIFSKCKMFQCSDVERPRWKVSYSEDYFTLKIEVDEPNSKRTKLIVRPLKKAMENFACEFSHKMFGFIG